MKRIFTPEEAREIGKKIGIDFGDINLGQFRMGLTVELEHGTESPDTNVTGDDFDITGRIAWAHLKEIPDYYTRLLIMESDGKKAKSDA